LLCAVLSVKDRELLNAIFPRVIDNAKMLRNFVQIMRSGAVGRKSLGSAPKRLVREWLDARDPAVLFKANVGQDPSLTDIVKMVHPKRKDEAREALFGYFIGREYRHDALPEVAHLIISRGFLSPILSPFVLIPLVSATFRRARLLNRERLQLL